MRLKIWLLIIMSLLSTSCSVFGIRQAEELKYEVLLKSKSIEIREYAPYVSAESQVKDSYENAKSILFRRLAGYIFGKNIKKQDIAMTAPVIMDSREISTAANDKIKMTSPVQVQTTNNGIWKMAFSMPSRYKLKDLPKPEDPDVQLKQITKKIVASIRYSGSFDNDERRKEKTKKLIAWIDTSQIYKKVGPPTFAGYNPPFTIPFLRRNEILIEVKVIKP